jgi:fluoride exporter
MDRGDTCRASIAPMARFLWICLAGAAGTGVRYLVSQGAARALGTAFPYGTLMVNVVGCFLIAAVAELALGGAPMTPGLRAVLTTGFMGGLTTYSSFNLETTRLLQDRPIAGIVNLAAKLGVCFLAGILGTLAVRRLGG